MNYKFGLSDKYVTPQSSYFYCFKVLTQIKYQAVISDNRLEMIQVPFLHLYHHCAILAYV